MGAINVGSLSVNSAGALTQSGAMSVAGLVTLNSGTSNITLSNTVAAANASFSNTSGTVAFQGDLALSTALVTTA
ncbi:MAG: hypothetical protein NTX09_16035 [Verrucomicrobia bacterium]|nr:hypothetical protein [Verrucomicrobiota bacterium]